MEPQVSVGNTVVDEAGRTVGRVIAVEYDHLVVEKGFIFTKTYYLPTDTIARVEGPAGHFPGRVHLSITGKRMEEIGTNNVNQLQQESVGASVDEAKFARIRPTATHGLDPARHTADEIAAPSNYADPYQGGDLDTADIARDRVKTLHDAAPSEQTIFEQAQIARRPAEAKKQ